ncbi:MAG: M48 family metallopeptidase [Patescibacteria group bacterium]
MLKNLFVEHINDIKELIREFTPEIIRSRRKTLAITISSKGKCVIRIPQKLPSRVVEQMILEKQNWIRTHLITQRQRSEQARLSLEEESLIQFLGQKYNFQWSEKETSIYLDNQFYFPIKFKSQIQQKLKNYYQKEARIVFQDRLNYWSEIMRLEFKSLKLSSAKTRWGSCSHDNNINLNWNMVMLELDLIDYVIVHELAHIKHKNHSLKFWSLVEEYMPDWKTRRKQLKANGHLLRIEW